VVIDYADPEVSGGERIGTHDYESFVAGGDPGYDWHRPADEWQAIALNYTSGTTGNPKGVVYHHRGAYLLAMGNILAASIGKHPSYLWTLPMFHCNGWCFPWTMPLVAGTNVCLRYVRSQAIWDALADEEVTHLCGAPIVMSTILNAPAEQKRDLAQRVQFITAAAPPPEAVLAAMSDAGFDVVHVYGLTETYGPAVVNEWKAEWDGLDGIARAAKKARQGVKYVPLEDLTVLDPESMEPVPADGETLGEVMFRGNVVMKGYLKNEAATSEAFAGGSIPAIWASCTQTATFSSRTALKTSLSQAAKISRQSRWRMYFTSIRRFRRPPWSPSRTTAGARHHAPSSS
jgi:fatty-acyl-CoA synthase